MLRALCAGDRAESGKASSKIPGSPTLLAMGLLAEWGTRQLRSRDGESKGKNNRRSHASPSPFE